MPLACRVNTQWLKAIATCDKDGLVECTSRDKLPDSKLILLSKGSAQPKLVCVDDHRLRTEQFQKLRVSAPVGTGSSWIRLEGLISSLGVDSERALDRFDQDYLNESIERLLQREPIIMYHSAGGLAASLPFWEILFSLDLQAIGVSPERFNPRVEPIDQR